MTDDINAKVTVDVSQATSALTSIDKNVSELRRELQALGIDLSTVNKNLDAIERGSNKASGGFKKATGGANEFSSAQNSIISQRYALYDLANFYGLVGAAAAGAGIYATVVGAQFQAAFSNVQRTMDASSTPDQIDAIRTSLINLSGQIPLTFQDLSKIATIGNQMGLAGDQVTGFTDTVARFSSVAGLSIDETSKAFGGFMAQTGLGAQYLENLGSSIAFVSLQSNATETEILALTKEIAAQASGAGFAADQIVGLAGSLARLRVPPERARGSLTTYFETLNKAVAEGGDKLNNFSIITGHTAEELTKMVASGQGATVLRDFLQGIGDTGNTIEATKALEALGLQQLRISDTVRRLSADLNAYDKDQANASSAFMQGAELSRQYSITIENLASQWQIFINGINAVVSAVSGGAIPTLTTLFEVINGVVFALANFISDNQGVARIIAFGLAVVSVTGALFILRGGILAARGAVLAFNLVQFQAAAAGIAGANGARAFAGGAITAGNAATVATGRVLGLGRALAVIGKTGLIGLALTAGGAILGKLAGGLVGTDTSAKNASLSLTQYNKAMADANAKMRSGSGEASNLADQLGGGGSGGGGGGGVSGAAADAAEKVRTLVEYVSDLTGVFKRSSDIRFGPQAAMDEITLKWITLNEKIEEYQRKVRTLTADKSLREYWLKNAMAYDDQIRAGQLREEIAKIDDQLAEANAGASTELKGNSKAAIENRKTMRDLAGSYDDYISALAAAGVSQSEIQSIIKNLNGDFVNQSSTLGYAGDDVAVYASRFADLSKIIDQVPRDITIGFNPDPAQAALDEFFAKVKEQAAAAGNAAGGGDGGGGFGGGLADGLSSGLDGASGQMNEFWNGEVDAAPDYGKGAGTIWAESLIDAATSLDFKRVWDLLVQAWNETVAQTNWFKNIKAIFDAGAVFFENIGKFWGDSVSINMTNSVTTGNPIGSWADAEKSRSGSYSAVTGNTIGSGISGGINSALTSTNPTGAWADSEKARSGAYSAITGNAIGSGISGGIGSTMNNSGVVSSWADNQVRSGAAWNSGAYAGYEIGGGIIGGIKNQLANFQITGSLFQSSGFGPLLGGYGNGHAQGGYTGKGHWLQPAGVVHRGEYVIPKKHVDQRTGLPDMRYVQSLRGAKSAPRAAYAGGGYVGGGMGNGPIELGPNSLGQIVNAMSVSIGIGRNEVARAASDGNRSLARAGSN